MQMLHHAPNITLAAVSAAHTGPQGQRLRKRESRGFSSRSSAFGSSLNRGLSRHRQHPASPVLYAGPPGMSGACHGGTGSPTATRPRPAWRGGLSVRPPASPSAQLHLRAEPKSRPPPPTPPQSRHGFSLPVRAGPTKARPSLAPRAPGRLPETQSKSSGAPMKPDAGAD